MAPVSRRIAAMLTAALVGGVLSACSNDARTGRDDDPVVIGGFVASPLSARYADSDEDTLQGMDGVAFPPLSVAVERVYAAGERGVSRPEAGSVYIESILRTSTGKLVVSFVREGERTSIDFETSDIPSFDSVFGSTTHDGHVYGVQLYTDLDTADSLGPWNYVSTARWYTYNLRPGASPYDGTVYELFGTYGTRTRPARLAALGSATYEGNILGQIRDADDPGNRTGRDLLRGSLTLDADLDAGNIGGEVAGLERYDYGADNPAWETLAESNSIRIRRAGISRGRFSAHWSGQDGGDTAFEDSVRGFEGTLLGEFYGPAGEEVGGGLQGHRSATPTTPEQLLSGFFSAGRPLDH